MKPLYLLGLRPFPNPALRTLWLVVDQATYDAVVADNQALRFKIEELTQRLDQLTRWLLGQSFERFISDEVEADGGGGPIQGGLFGTVTPSEESSTTIAEHERKSPPEDWPNSIIATRKALVLYPNYKRP